MRCAYDADRPEDFATSFRSKSHLQNRCSVKFRPASAAHGAITLDAVEMEAMLAGGAGWAVERGWGERRDLARIEESGEMAGPARMGLRTCQGTAAAAKWARSVRAITISKSRSSPKSSMPRSPRRLDFRFRRCCHHYPLRLARSRPSDRHRVPEGNGGCGAKHRASS